MIETQLPLPPERSATVQAPDDAPILEQLATLRLENAVLRTQNAALQQRIRELEARLAQDSSNSSRVTEYQMVVICCTHCGRRTRVRLPAGVPRRRF